MYEQVFLTDGENKEGGVLDVRAYEHVFPTDGENRVGCVLGVRTYVRTNTCF